MTRKDYEFIAAAIDRARAAIIRNTRHDYAERAAKLQATALVAASLAHDLEGGNPRFDTSRFYGAATEGPLFLSTINDENLARDLGPGDSQAASTTDRHVKLAP